MHLRSIFDPLLIDRYLERIRDLILIGLTCDMSLISNTNDYVCCFLFQGEDKTHTGVNAEENRATDQQVNQNSEDSKLLQLLTY